MKREKAPLAGYKKSVFYASMPAMLLLLYTTVRTTPAGFVTALGVNVATRKVHHVGVIGGGASGVFAAIAAAVENRDSRVTVLEASSKALAKVKISGGGRCNVMHDYTIKNNDNKSPYHSDISLLLNKGYPRGNKELNGIFNKGFGPAKVQAWFEQHGVQLKTEADGRMFPVTDSSQTIIDTLLNAADDANVEIKYRCKVNNIFDASTTDSSRFIVEYAQKDGNDNKNNATTKFDTLIIATGSAPAGYSLATGLGHSIVKTVPSLFTLSTKADVSEGGILHGLSGLSVPVAQISYCSIADGTMKKSKNSKSLVQQGPILITHHGLSGPAALKLSAFGARHFAESNYKGTLKINWIPEYENNNGKGSNVEAVNAKLWQVTTTNPRKNVASICPLLLPDGSTAVPKRLWASLVSAAELNDKVWGEVSKKAVRKLADLLCNCELEMTGKGTFKEEFVTAGGVDLKEIDMKTMQSKIVPGLYFAGELINVDGITGGFNFMNCWSTGYVAGTNAASSVVQQSSQKKLEVA